MSASVSSLLDVPVPPQLLPAFELVRNVSGRGKNADVDVYVGRTFAGRTDVGWGNPFPVQGTTARARVASLTAFADLLRSRDDLIERVGTLAGLTLGCWCAPLPCHGHLLAGYAAGYADATDAWLGQLTDVAATTPPRLLVTGSRTYTDRRAVADALLAAWDRWDRDPAAVLVVGDATGADELAASCWEKAGLTVEVHYARWDELGRKAGPVRNAEMIASGVDAAVAFPVGASRGTRDCIAQARRGGVPVTVIE